MGLEYDSPVAGVVDDSPHIYDKGWELSEGRIPPGTTLRKWL